MDRRGNSSDLRDRSPMNRRDCSSSRRGNPSSSRLDRSFNCCSPNHCDRSPVDRCERSPIDRCARLSGQNDKSDDDGWENVSSPLVNRVLFPPSRSASPKSHDSCSQRSNRSSRSSSCESRRSSWSSPRSFYKSSPEVDRITPIGKHNAFSERVSRRTASPRFSHHPKELNYSSIIDLKYKSPTRRSPVPPKTVRFENGSNKKRGYVNRRRNIYREYTPRPPQCQRQIVNEDSSFDEGNYADSSVASQQSSDVDKSYDIGRKIEFLELQLDIEREKERQRCIKNQKFYAKPKPDFEVYCEPESDNGGNKPVNIDASNEESDDDWGEPTAPAPCAPQDPTSKYFARNTVQAFNAGGLPLGISARWQLQNPGWRPERFVDKSKPGLYLRPGSTGLKLRDYNCPYAYQSPSRDHCHSPHGY